MSQKFAGKYIFSDFDGTLVHDGKIPQRNIDAVKYFTDNGGLFSISTGRALTSVRYAIEGSGLVVNGPLICLHGALVYDDAGGKRMSASEMDGVIYDVGHYIVKNYPTVGLEVMYDDKVILVRHDEFNAFHMRMEKMDITESKLEDVGQPLQKMLVTGTPEVLSILEKDLAAFPGFDFNTMYTHPSFFEILAKGLTKAVGVKYAAEHFHIRPEDVVVIGDYTNDLEALQMAGLAVVPENGLPEIRQIADKIVCPCQDGSIADAIDYLEKMK